MHHSGLPTSGNFTIIDVEESPPKVTHYHQGTPIFSLSSSSDCSCVLLTPGKKGTAPAATNESNDNSMNSTAKSRGKRPKVPKTKSKMQKHGKEGNLVIREETARQLVYSTSDDDSDNSKSWDTNMVWEKILNKDGGDNLNRPKEEQVRWSDHSDMEPWTTDDDYECPEERAAIDRLKKTKGKY